MIRSMMLWDMELAWRTQSFSSPSIKNQVDYNATRKITRAYRYASIERVLAITGIEPPHIINAGKICCSHSGKPGCSCRRTGKGQ